MRPHGRADISQTSPRATAICDRCGAMVNHDQLRWAFDWRGPKLQNLRFLVCQSCLDAYQQNGQRTIVLPADPIPIKNARPEYYVPDNNPLSALGASPTLAANPMPSMWQYSNQIGTMVNQAGVPSAFDGNANKPSAQSAVIAVSKSSFNNYVGINWAGNANALNMPSSLKGPVLTHTLSSYTITAPNDATFGSTGYMVQGSPVDAGWGSWTTVASGDTVGTVGEVISGTPSGGRYQFHRVAFYGNGGSQISVAQVSLSVADGSSQ